jgi:hypothetical protein
MPDHLQRCTANVTTSTETPGEQLTSIYFTLGNTHTEQQWVYYLWTPIPTGLY